MAAVIDLLSTSFVLGKFLIPVTVTSISTQVFTDWYLLNVQTTKMQDWQCVAGCLAKEIRGRLA